MANPFEVDDPTQRGYDNYTPAGFPDPRDTQVDDYLTGLKAGGPQEVHAAIDAASEKGKRVLLAYSERAASRAVRTGARETLVLGLIALVVGGLEQNALEALMVMPLYEDASRRIGLELADLFEEVAAIVGQPGTVNLMIWLTRAPEDRTLGCMGFTASEDETGFRYRRID